MRTTGQAGSPSSGDGQLAGVWPRPFLFFSLGRGFVHVPNGLVQHWRVDFDTAWVPF